VPQALSDDPGRRAGLLGAKLAGLVRAHFPDAERDGARAPGDLPGAASLVEGRRAWVLLDNDPVTSFGPSLVWAGRRGIADLPLLTESDAGTLARRATCFAAPPVVWHVSGTDLAQAAPDPIPAARTARPAPELAEQLIDAGLEVVVEDGIVRGEVNGLEVARVVHDRTTAGVPIDQPLLEVGVGKADRELTAMLHSGMSPTEQLARVVEIVRQHRRAGASPHPLNQLVKDRWLRARLVANPSHIGLAELRPVETAVPRPNLRDAGSAAAAGHTRSGAPVVVVCSVGIHLDLVPAAADTRLAIDPDAPLWLAMPARDAHPVTEALAARTVPPARLVAIDGDWRDLP
jgi:hypothetical protein